MRRFVFASLLVTGFTLGVPAPLASAPVAQEAGAARLVVRAGVHADFQRVVFDWPQAVSYTLEQSGAVVALRFSSVAHVDFRDVRRRHLSDVRDVTQRQTGAGTLVLFTLTDNRVARSYQDRGRVVIDFRKGTPPPARLLSQEVAFQKPVDDTPSEHLPDVALPESPLADVPEKNLLEATKPAAEAPVPVPETPGALSDPKPKEEAAPVVAVPVQPAPVALEIKNDETDSTVKAGALEAKPENKYSAPDIGTLGDQPVTLLSFDPGLQMGAAIFRRADFVYLVFERTLSQPLEKMLRQSVVALERVESLSGSAYRFYLPQEASLRVTRDEAVWSIHATQKVRAAPISLSVQAQPNYALGGRLILPLSKAGDPVRLYDPEVGDLLLVLPLAEPGQAIRMPYHYTDVQFVPSEQGVILRPRVDGVEVKRLTQGVEITAPNGLRLSSHLDTGLDESETGGEASGSRLFDFRGWYGPKARGYTAMRQRWERALAEVPVTERDRVRFSLARFMFARNHPQEALGILDLLKAQVPDIERRSEFLALRGAAYVLAARPEDALKDFTACDTPDHPEIKLWRGLANAQLLAWSEAVELLLAADAVLDGYPEPFFTKFSIIAAEAGLAADNRVYAANVFDRLLQRRPELQESSAAVNYLRGVFMGLAGHHDRAEIFWKRAAAISDQMYNVRARLSLIDLGVVQGKITPGEAAERLERLRYAWRGDDLELDILRRLGKFYIESGKVEDGLATMKQVLAFLPENQTAEDLRQEMAFTFRDVFLGERGKKLSPLDALSLYERFYELAPAGDEGDAIIRSLAERMVAVDLLDRAAEVLEDQAKRRLTGTLKARVGTQAAGIFLLDHKADRALEALEATNEPSMPEELKRERLLLKAKALSEQEKNEEARSLIVDQESEYAQRLKADIAWRARNWADAARELEWLIGPPPQESGKLNPQMAQLVVNRAIALALSSNSEGLDALKKDFGGAMANTPQKDLFKVLTEPESGLPRDENAMKSFMADVDLFQDFLENYRKIK